MSAAKRKHSVDQSNELKLLRRYIADQQSAVAKRSKQVLARADPEDVHQMRVATRRLRAALFAIGKTKSKIAGDIRWLTRSLGPVRDLDVQMAQLGDSGADQRFQQYLQSQRTPARRQLLRALKTKRLQRLFGELETLRHSLDKSAALKLHASIYEELKHIKRSGSRIKQDTPFERLHRLRIHCKRLRYQIEILNPAHGTSLHAVLSELKQLLDRLGELQDSRVTVAHVLEYEDTLEANDLDHKSLERMLNKQERRAEKIRQSFPGTWQRFEKKLSRSLNELQP